MNAVKKMFGKGKADGGASSSSSSASSHGDIDLAAGKRDAVAVGLPAAGVGMDKAVYQDTTIESTATSLPVGQVQEGVARGKDIEFVEKIERVPVTKMVTEEVEVPETRFETVTVTKPVTRTKDVVETVRDVEIQNQEVVREEIVLDKKVVQEPTTIMKPVMTEVPRVYDKVLRVPQVHEEMRTITVVRPRQEMRTVTVLRPVEVKKLVKGKRPVMRTKTVSTKVPVRRVKKVNVTQPEIVDDVADIKVAVDRPKHVEYEKPVTVIRASEAEKVERDTAAVVATTTKTGSDAVVEDKYIAEVDHDFNEIPVGLPFTELVKKSENFTERVLEDRKEKVRNTLMKPHQFDKVDYELVPTEVEIIVAELEDYEEEVIVSELQEVEEQVEVTVMDRIKEDWPVPKKHYEEVYTSFVTLEPVTTEVPEIGTKEVEIEVPRTVMKTETIEKPVPVEHQVTVQKAYTEEVAVQMERAVEGTKTITVEKPVTEYEERTVSVPVSVDKKVAVAGVTETNEQFREDTAHAQMKSVAYKTAVPTTKAYAVTGDIQVEDGVQKITATDKDLALAKERGVEMEADGYKYGAVVKDGYAEGSNTDLKEGRAYATAAVPGAVLGAVPVHDVSVEGHGVGMRGVPTHGVAAGTVDTANVDNTAVYREMRTETTVYKPTDEVVADGTATKEKKGLFGKIKDKLSN